MVQALRVHQGGLSTLLCLGLNLTLKLLSQMFNGKYLKGFEHPLSLTSRSLSGDPRHGSAPKLLRNTFPGGKRMGWMRILIISLC